MKRHWSERPSGCICGKQFRSHYSEMRHRHNFPALCNMAGLKKFYAEQARNAAPVTGAQK